MQPTSLCCTQCDKKITGIHFPQCPVSFKLSVYSDDLLVFTHLQDITVLTNNVNQFGFISSAMVNWEKSLDSDGWRGLRGGLKQADGLQWKTG